LNQSNPSSFDLSRIQEKCQPRNDAGDDEDGFVHVLPRLPERTPSLWTMNGDKVTDSVFVSGHVEKTNDRDYEIEERYGSKTTFHGL
jgi:hypothetical protein